MTNSPDHKTVRALERALPLWIWFAAVIVPIAVALLLVPSRGHLGPADDALVLVVVTVAIASWGNRGAAALAALVSAASFDFLLTRPYGSFRISRPGDITT
jgi:K+-sensing histidine kinase KdpD